MLTNRYLLFYNENLYKIKTHGAKNIRAFTLKKIFRIYT
ncbi:MAG: hypothetical protein K0S32_1682 [Bacteroidetes bacterium]|jgi:hypothetical protein|nr:hypothetical protein [Bacteroidota bacterium]